MRKLLITDGFISYELWVDQIKILFGSHYSKKFELIKIIEQIFNKTPLSENQKDNAKSFAVKLDNVLLDSKNANYFRIDPFYDLQSDLRMQSKSLVLKYLEAKISDLDYAENFETFDQLLVDFVNQINEGESVLHWMSQGFSFKTLPKLMASTLLVDEIELNQYDLNLVQIVQLQVDMISFIAKKNPQMHFIIAFQTQTIDSMLKELEERLPINTTLLIISDTFHTPTELEKYCLFTEKMTLDLANEEDIYFELVNLLGTYLNYEEVIAQLRNYIRNEKELLNKFVTPYLK